MDKFKLYIISHTHWDREWYEPFQQYRYRLVRAMDNLIATLEQDPSFPVFHLDGQTIVLEDYLEVRPEMKTRLAKLIQANDQCETYLTWVAEPLNAFCESRRKDLLDFRRDDYTLSPKDTYLDLAWKRPSGSRRRPSCKFPPSATRFCTATSFPAGFPPKRRCTPSTPTIPLCGCKGARWWDMTGWTTAACKSASTAGACWR